MVDVLSLVSVFWRPDIIWRTGTFDFGTVAVLFGVSLVFAVGMTLWLGNPARRMFALVSLVPILVAWVFLFPLFMGAGGLEIEGGFGLLRGAGSVIGGNLAMIVVFLVLWGVFELVVLRGLMVAVSLALHHPMEAHVDAWVVAPLIEEYAFRWVLMGMLLGWGVGLGMAILVQGLVFAVSHVKNGLVYGLDSWVGIVGANITVPLGFALGSVAVSYGLLYAFLLHVVFNVVFDIVSILSGGRTG